MSRIKLKNIISGVAVGGLLLILGLTGLLLFSPITLHSGWTSPPPVSIDSQEVAQAINHWRQEHGLVRLREDPLLCEIAKKRAMKIHIDWSHDGFPEKSDYIYENSTFIYTGENLGKYATSEMEMVQAWLKSPGHKENIASEEFTHGCVVSIGGYVVQIFAGY